MRSRIHSLIPGTLLLILTLAASPLPAAGSRDSASSGKLSTDDWSGIREAHTAWAYSFREVLGGYAVRHPGHRWSAGFDSCGFLTTSDDGAWRWGLELAAYGFPGAMLTLAEGRATEVEQSSLVRRWDGNIQEWYVNDQRGLEHGFTISRRPDGAGVGAPLSIELTVRGDLRPHVSDDGQSVNFHDALDRAALTYGGLKVWDADGSPVSARMVSLAAGSVRIEVNESGARYPLTVDPVAAPVYVKAFNTGGGDSFGSAIAVSGETVVIGAHLEDGAGAGVNPPDSNTGGDSGAAYVFVRNGGTWIQQAYLKASNPGNGDFFGKSVAISGDTIVVGAYYEDGIGTGVNPLPTEGADQAGAAYVFVRSGGTWAPQAYLKASNTQGNDQFGISVAVSGDTIVVGAALEDGGGTGINPPVNEGTNNSGAAYVFVRNAGTWTQQAYVKASNPGADDNFGNAVTVSGNTMAIASYLEDGGGSGVNPPVNEGLSDSGAVWIFTRSGTLWTQQAYLKASNPGVNDWFGYSVALSGNTLVCGAPAEDGSGTGVNPPNNNGGPDSGAAYVFVRNGATWSQQAYLKASNNSVIDQFGYSVGVDGDLVVAGAPREDGSGLRINPVPNEGIVDSGAAWVFSRSGTTWSPLAYLKATNTGPDDLFGTSVAISGDLVAVGAISEDGGGIGVSPPDTAFAAGAGAAYFFSGIGPLPDQDADGVVDVFETYFGTSPTTPGGVPWTVSASAGQVRLRWPEANTTGVTVSPQWSPDLVTWLASGETRNGITARTIAVAGAGGNLREATLNISGLSRAALRLKLTCP